jgi:hypothetical protein
MYTYTHTSNPNVILRSDGASIPADPLNRDYAEYLQWVAAGNTAAPAPGPDLNALKTDLMARVDALVADIYSNWTRFQQEYILREQAATDFASRGFTGDPGIWVSAFATAAGYDNKTAAQLILGQANQLNSALMALAAQRMSKYNIAKATTVQGATDAYNAVVSDIKSIAATIT